MRVALAFPDVYEVGMSHLGLKILYKIINDMPFASAERVFSPWLDLDDHMKKNNILLSSLESGRPLKDFDVVGFSLQYELSYTTVLNMLHLGGIPLRSEERMESTACPLVIAGGPCTANPHPMAEFIDAFLIGDGEDAIKEILDLYYHWKNAGSNDRQYILKSLSGVEGIFVPLINKKTVTRRFISSLDDAPFPDNPVVPFTNIIHDRVNIEISRGCSMGCRFCQAGMIYRPVRERSLSNILTLAERSLKNTGHDSISFTSLSAGEHSCLLELMHEMNQRNRGKRISISLPSLRVASVNSDVLKQIRAVRKTGFTIAPEAGTERLRSVINKDFTEEIYIQALEALFREGWQSLKLYFMTGLPTETDEDINAIPEMVLKAIKISRKLTGRHASISVGISSFVPKPHTPFQWFGQNNIQVLKEKNRHLRKSLLKRGVQFKGHDEEMSLLEAAFARGDASLSKLIEAAWSLGCRLDAWTESFDFDIWKKAMDISGVNAVDFATKEYDRESHLPWDNISTGITKEYLSKEYENAVSGRFTSDCRKTCHNCGLKCKTERQEMQTEIPSLSPPLEKKGLKGGESIKVRVRYSKTGKAAYLSHLELITAIIRAMRRADIPFRYSEGFHPAPKISFGPALGVGTAGIREYLDLELVSPFGIETGLKDLNNTLPVGIRISEMVFLTGKEKSLNSFITRYVYEVEHKHKPEMTDFLKKEEVIVKRKQISVNIKDMVEEISEIDENRARITLCDLGDIKVRLDEIIPAIFNASPEEVVITRTAMSGWDGQWKEPIEESRA